MAAGEHITVCDEGGTEYDCELVTFAEDFVEGRFTERCESKAEPCFFAHVYQGLPKGDKLDLIIQKSVECGACALTTFESDFCIAKSKPDAEHKKLERRQRIALEAAKQSGRGRIPEIYPTVSFDEMIEKAAESDIVLFCYEGENTKPIGHYLRGGVIENIAKREGRAPRIAVIIGSEGGFSEKEADEARAAGLTPVNLGPRILRCETAPAYVLSVISYFFEL
jgi:16S rRNA (uracil1498-N3)-methyltransferase